MPLSATITRSRWRLRDELELTAAVDRERREVARVDPDHRCFEGGRAFELLRVVRLDERVEPEVAGAAHQLGGLRVVEVAEKEQDGVRARLLRRPQVLGRREEALCEQRQPRRRARGTQVVPVAAEALVDEHRDGGRSGALVGGGEPGGVGVGADVAERRRAALELGDRGEPGG